MGNLANFIERVIPPYQGRQPGKFRYVCNINWTTRSSEQQESIATSSVLGTAVVAHTSPIKCKLCHGELVVR